jgi:hypothetical protein
LACIAVGGLQSSELGVACNFAVSGGEASMSSSPSSLILLVEVMLLRSASLAGSKNQCWDK